MINFKKKCLTTYTLLKMAKCCFFFLTFTYLFNKFVRLTSERVELDIKQVYEEANSALSRINFIFTKNTTKMKK